jgi:hypothetical protein
LRRQIYDVMGNQMSRINHLTLEEHTEVGALLAAIAVPTWDGRTKGSRVSRHCRRSSKYLKSLRHDLIDLVCERYDTGSLWQS